MFGKFSEQLKKTSKPVSNLFAMNAKVLEDLSAHQTELFTGLLSDGVKYMESVSVQPDLKGVLAANSEYAESVRERITSVSKENYGTLNAAREQVTDLVKSAFEETATDTQKAASQAVKTATESAEKAQSAAKRTTNTVAKKTNAATKQTASAAKDAPKVAQTAATTAAQASKEAASEIAPATKPEAKSTSSTAAKKTTRTRRTTSSAAKKTTTKSTK
ncbi:phasin family protein [Alteromonas antoniana]|uniref:phasin family protein n=1 Tax=Alteromonas antoniana TaxID=2803813 RepID=UPI001C4671BB|nr:phasin family protein [Alteromonas antoniana]